MKSKTFKFNIYFPGELAAGLYSFSDRVTVTVESGDPGGDQDGPDSFAEYMRIVLAEWYDGAGVTIAD